LAEILDQIVRLPAYMLEGMKYHLGGSLFTAKPRMIQFPVCDRCNARCIMCSRWQKDVEKEISIEKIREVFSSGLFSKVEDVNLHGGEPTLRQDLAEICSIIQSACPRMKRLWISTNGFGSQRVEKRIQEILDVLDFSRIDALEINVSIDGINETHDTIRGIKGGFKQSIETIKALKRLAKNNPIRISIGTVIQPLNLHQIDDIEQLARELDVSVFFQPLMFDKFFNLSGNSNLKFSKDDIREFKRVIEQKLAPGLSTTNFYWCDFLSIMSGEKRKSPCAFDRYVLSLYPTGEVLPCSREDWILFGNVYEQSVDEIWFGRKAKEIRKRMREKVCPGCSFYCGVEFSLQKEFFIYLKFYLKRYLSKAVAEGGKNAS
jgi:MoaA/NifB/PqqE/SkfB family radical SAM enzyme